MSFMPFLKPKDVPAVVQMKRKSDDGPMETSEVNGVDMGKRTAMEDFMSAHKMGDADGMSRALDAHYDISSSAEREPEVESQDDDGDAD